MGGIKRMSLPYRSYDSCVKKWQASTQRKEFAGHFLISFVTNTNQIEDINVSYNSTRELFESEQVTNYTGDLRSLFSVINNKSVAGYLNAQLKAGSRISPELILETHRLLMYASMDSHRYHDNGERAGTFKQKDYCVGQLGVGSLPEDVPEDVRELCKDIEDISDKDPLKVAAVFQCHFEYIHPFADGNGRVGRWLTNYLLMLNNHPPILFTREARQEYYDALEAFDATEDYEAMYAYLRKQTTVSFPALREML